MSALDVLFIHANFPAQFRRQAQLLSTDPRFRVVAVGGRTAKPIEGVRLERYTLPKLTSSAHPFARRMDVEARRAEQVMYALIGLKREGVSPRIIFVHPGWGEALPVREVFPDAKIVLYCEFYYRSHESDADFDPEIVRFGVDGRIRVQMKNAATLLAAAQADCGIAPTAWQRSTFPPELQAKIQVLHEGVDVGELQSDKNRSSAFARHLRQAAGGAPILTYVARSLEPYRGFHSFMRALPFIQRSNPLVHTFIVGEEAVSYGTEPDGGGSWKEALLREVGVELDMRRTHFLGKLKYAEYLTLLDASDLHLYLTYPFVLSWSLVEALALGKCVLASDTGPVQEVIREGENGLLVPFFDHQAIAARALDVLAKPALYGALGANAKSEAIARFDWHRAIRPRFESLVDALL